MLAGSMVKEASGGTSEIWSKIHVKFWLSVTFDDAARLVIAGLLALGSRGIGAFAPLLIFRGDKT
jgi:hypothetical protein